MADPQPYSVSYSFSGFQVNNPATPLPAPRLDNELLNLQTSIAAIVAAIKDVRRSDGALPNGKVTFDSLALAVQLMLDPSDATLVANAVAAAQAAAASAGSHDTAAAESAAAALASAIAAAASAAAVDLTLFLPKAGNLAGLGSQATSRSNLGLGTAATLNVGGSANNIVQLDGNAKIPAYDGSQITNIDTVPIGTTIWFNGSAPPFGFLKENGSLLSRATFPRLWAYVVATGYATTEANWFAGASGIFSTGDLSTTFRIPDARGEFFRAFDDGRGVDNGRINGTNQSDAFKSHTHGITAAVQGNNASDITPGSVIDAVNTALTTNATGGSETRPRNISKLACIKAY
jgi:hypothetical protein